MLAAERTGSVRLAASCHDLQGASPEKMCKGTQSLRNDTGCLPFFLLKIKAAK